MHRTKSHRRKAKHLNGKKGFVSSIKGVSHLSRRAKRRLYCKLQLWMWRKRREKCHLWMLRAKRRVCRISSGSCLGVKMPSLENKSKVASPLGCDTGGSEDVHAGKNGLLKPCESVFTASSSMQNQGQTDCGVSAGDVATVTVMMPSQKTETLAEPSENTNRTSRPLLSTDIDSCGSETHFKEAKTPAQKLEANGRSGETSAVPAAQQQAAHRTADQRATSTKMPSSHSAVSLVALTEDIHEFLNDFYRRYGSFIPLQKTDVLLHLKRRFDMDFSDRKNIIFAEVAQYRAAIIQKPAPSFRVVHKKHSLTLDDLSTLADQNWLNDQVMNMYGELIMEAAHHKVHFLNSFFHRQLMTKGYDGVKRWTKQVDLFSKSLLLVPIHLEVHWCLVTADNIKKEVCLYDSQGNALQKVARNILKYLMAEAKEKKQTAFESGWAVSFDEKIPQQTNENDCGVFVLEYSRCLALGKPLQFSQRDIPKIRKRIYKELCDCKLHEQG